MLGIVVALVILSLFIHDVEKAAFRRAHVHRRRH